jgi:hypothetical protein
MTMLEELRKRILKFADERGGWETNCNNKEDVLRHEVREFIRDIKYITRHACCNMEHALEVLKSYFPEKSKLNYFADFWHSFSDDELLRYLDNWHFWHIENGFLPK